MSDVMVRVRDVSKRYRIGGPQRRDDQLREAITRAVTRLFRALKPGRREPAADETLWALREVSFDVSHGEVLGIIGRNGAGKTTLLKVLSRITEPTHGRVESYGRVGSLLEVGTGFHPELTGRENVFLNGSILGMRRAEVERKFDEIVAFSGVERFLDTPVKRYSSGMYVRLAFAVAAHLEPEILIVDEVLAVGDVEFQKRCLQKMDGVARGGRTVLLVSHNMGTVQAFCTRAILLREGRIAAEGAPDATVQAYLRGFDEIASTELSARSGRGGAGAVRLASCEVSSPGAPPGVLAAGQAARFIFDVPGFRPGVTCKFTVHDQLGRVVTSFDSGVAGASDAVVAHARSRMCCDVEELLLVPGRYRIDATLWSGGDVQDHVEAAAVFDVTDGLVRGRPTPRRVAIGEALIPHRWELPS